MNTLLWSVTIPTYNASEFIAETSRSVLAQNVSADKMEIVVVDNCSTDDTLAIAKSIGGERIKIVVNDRNLGVHGNFNKCVEVAEGELIHMLHADDLVKSGFYQAFEDAFERYPQVSLVCCGADLIDESGKIIGASATPKTLINSSTNVAEMMYVNYILTPCVVIRKDAYIKLGGFDTSFFHLGDWDMWMRVVHNLGGLHLENILAQYRVHSKSGSAANMSTGIAILEIERIYKKFISFGYPIDESVVNTRLRNYAKDNYIIYYYANNGYAASNMLRLYKRYSSQVHAFSLVARTFARKRIGIIKRMVVK